MKNSYKSGILGYLLITILAFSPLVTVAETLEPTTESEPVVEVVEEVEVPVVEEPTPESLEEDVVDEVVVEEVVDNLDEEDKTDSVNDRDENNENATESFESDKDLINDFVQEINENLLTPIVSPLKEESSSKENVVTFVEKVELGVIYKFTHNEQVQVTFTKLPENPGSLSIEEVILTPEQVKAFGTFSNVAYDITSSMENGTFEYELKLPIPEGVKEVSKVVYAETVEELESNVIEEISNKKVDVDTNINSVVVSELDHFTIFVVVSAPIVAPNSPVWPIVAGDFIYNAIPTNLPPSVPSLGYQATQTYELGDKITFATDTSRNLVSGLVTLTSWACETNSWSPGPCITTPGATFQHPITLSLYEVAGDGTVGSLIIEVTDTFDIPYRPSADATCADTKQWKDGEGNCFNGYNHIIAFDLTGTTVPDNVIYGISYDTQTYGASPIGVDGPYTSLNVALSTNVSVGTDNNSDELFWDTTYSGYTRGFKADDDWGYGVAVAFTAEPVVVNALPTLTVESPAENQIVSTMGDKLTVEGIFTDDVKANYATLQLVYNGNSKAIGTFYGYGSVFNPAATYANEDGSYSYELEVPADLEDGEYSLFYTGTDFEGGVTDRMERKILIDNTSPTVPVITTPIPRQWFKATSIKNEWSAASDANGIKEYQIAYAYDDKHTFSGSTCSDVTEIDGKKVSGCRNTSGTSRNHSPENSEQGGVTIWVRAIDNAGNVSPWSSSVHYYYDNESPTTDINVSSVVSNEFTVSGIANDNISLNRVYVQLVDRQTNTRVGGKTINLIGVGTTSPWSVTYKVSDLGEGNFAAHVSATDMAGNSGSAGWTDNFSIELENTDNPTTPTKTETTIVVTGDTSSGESQLGWLFNRDKDTKTPFEFTSDESVLGSGSLYVLPISSANASDKFIAEYFPEVDMSDLTSFSVDYKMGEGNEDEFRHVYLNVYANFEESNNDKFYDCRYNVVATTGSENNFSTLTFDPTQPYTVTTHGTSPAGCPSVPADMNTGSNVRAIAINLGDESAEDDELSAYFDNVVLETTTEITKFDFEPTPTTSQPEDNNQNNDSPSTSSDDSRRSSSRRTLGGSSSAGEVLGASTGLNHVCNGMYLNTYLKEGVTSSDVALLQTFLNSEGASLPVTSYFGALTKAAVMAFQNKYADEILKPWAVSATGYVFKTTRWKINNIVCPGSEDFPMIP